MKNEIAAGKKFDLGEIILSEQEIIDFAKGFDPLDFHVDKEAAKKTMFKGIIASGPHVFNAAYQRKWLPLFGKTVICGMGVSNWKFIKPVYPDQKIKAEVMVLAVKPDPKIAGLAVNWQFEFKNEKGEMVQFLQTEIMHKIQ